MIRSEKEAREASIELLDKMIDFQKKNISGLEVMKEHINDMTSEQFNKFSAPFAVAMVPEMFHTILKSHSAICATNDTIEQIKKEVE